MSDPKFQLAPLSADALQLINDAVEVYRGVPGKFWRVPGEVFAALESASEIRTPTVADEVGEDQQPS